MRVCSSGESRRRSSIRFEKLDIVEAQVLLAEGGLQTGDLGCEQATQVAPLAAYGQTDLAIAHHCMHLDAAEGLRTQTDMHF